MKLNYNNPSPADGDWLPVLKLYPDGKPPELQVDLVVWCDCGFEMQDTVDGWWCQWCGRVHTEEVMA